MGIDLERIKGDETLRPGAEWPRKAKKKEKQRRNAFGFFFLLAFSEHPIQQPHHTLTGDGNPRLKKFNLNHFPDGVIIIIIIIRIRTKDTSTLFPSLFFSFVAVSCVAFVDVIPRSVVTVIHPTIVSLLHDLPRLVRRCHDHHPRPGVRRQASSASSSAAEDPRRMKPLQCCCCRSC